MKWYLDGKIMPPGWEWKVTMLDHIVTDENHFPVSKNGFAKGDTGIKDDGHHNCPQSLKKGLNKPETMISEINDRKDKKGDKGREDKGHRRCQGSPDSPDPVPDISNYLDHGSPRDQLAEGYPSHELSLFQPGVSIYGCLFNLTDHCGAAIGCCSKFENPCE